KRIVASNVMVRTGKFERASIAKKIRVLHVPMEDRAVAERDFGYSAACLQLGTKPAHVYIDMFVGKFGENIGITMRACKAPDQAIASPALRKLDIYFASS